MLEYGAVLPHVENIELRERIALLEQELASMRAMLTTKDAAMDELEERHRESAPVVAQLKSHIEWHNTADALIETRNEVVNKMEEVNAANYLRWSSLRVMYGNACDAKPPGKRKRKRMAQMSRECKSGQHVDSS